MDQLCCGCDKENGGHEVINEPVSQPEVIRGLQTPEPEPTKPEKFETAEHIDLTVELVGARGLRNADWWPGYGKSDCYCAVKCRGKTLHTTKVISDCLEPTWRETVEGLEWEVGQNLEFHIFDKDVLTSNFLGKVILESQSFATEGFNNEVQIAEAGTDNTAFLRLKIKVPGKDFPPPPLTTFEIEVSKGDAPAWGLDCDMQDPRMISVSSVKAGPFQLYNQGAPPEKRLKENDFIKSVNGVEGNTKDMVAQFKAQKKMKIVIVRSVQFTVALDLTNPSSSIGLTLVNEPLGNHLVIFKVLDSGAVPDYNKKVMDGAPKIMDGDRIMAARGVKGNSGHLQTELTKTRGKIQLTLLRPAMEN